MHSFMQIEPSRSEKQRRLNRIEIDAIKHRWRLGETRSSLAECFEISERSIRFHCRKIPRPQSRRLVDVNEVIAMRAMGLSLTEVAYQLEFERTSILRALRKAGKPNGRREDACPSYQPIAEA